MMGGMRVVCGVFLAVAAAGVSWAQDTPVKERIAGEVFRNLAKGFVAVADVDKIKLSTLTKINAMNKEQFRAYYADFYQHASGWPYLTSEYHLRADIPKEEVVAKVRALNKQKLFAIIDSVPDELVAREYRNVARLYGSQSQGSGGAGETMRVVNAMIQSALRKYAGQY